ncbi:MAG: glycerol kinase GlpK, partial [Candidatus Cloacimonetes bacterium]|nr:glycerol kinase GlpK [Candidatus Cloacimonadota bacterium]
MPDKYIGAIDQGTTSSRFMIFNHNGEVSASAQMPHKQHYPKSGWVEHDAFEILRNTYELIKQALHKAKLEYSDLSAIGITNQRETVVVWDKNYGQPLYHAIVWQDTRTEYICRELERLKGKEYFSLKTGLPIATYFSGSKLKWLRENVPEIEMKLESGDALVGTIDSWLLWNLNGRKHLTDITNASRTLLYNINDCTWDSELLELFRIPESALPTVLSSVNSEGFGTLHIDDVDTKVPITCVLGDQQAAIFGQTCFHKGDAKCTYGTGAFILMNIGSEIYQSKYGLLTTVAYAVNSEKPVYALEGSIAMAGSLVQWLRDNMGMIRESDEIETLAINAEDNDGVYCVPAFSGLFAPYWNGNAQGL